MRFSVMIWPHSGEGVQPVARLAKVAEDSGFETVRGFGYRYARP